MSKEAEIKEMADTLAKFFNDPIDKACKYCDAAEELWTLGYRKLPPDMTMGKEAEVKKILINPENYVNLPYKMGDITVDDYQLDRDKVANQICQLFQLPEPPPLLSDEDKEKLREIFENLPKMDRCPSCGEDIHMPPPERGCGGIHFR